MVRDRFNAKTGKFCLNNRLFCAFLGFAFVGTLRATEGPALGPMYQDVKLTLEPGHRIEAAGPFYYHQVSDSTRVWGFPPLFSYTHDPDIDYAEFDFLYPVIGYDRFGPEYRFHIFQLLAFAGGQTQSETNVSRFTLFPI